MKKILFLSFVFLSLFTNAQWLNYSPPPAWLVTGNTLGNSTSWLGSIDNYDVGFKTNNTYRWLLDKNGRLTTYSTSTAPNISGMSCYTGKANNGYQYYSQDSTQNGWHTMWSNATQSLAIYMNNSTATQFGSVSNSDLSFFANNSGGLFYITRAGFVGTGTNVNMEIGDAGVTPTARLHIKAGSTSIAPLRMLSGALTTGTNILAGNHEFLTDKAYLTISTGTVQKEFTLNDAALTSGRVPFVTTNGRLTDAASMTYNTSTGLNLTTPFITSSTSTLTGNAIIGADLIPNADNTSVLGSSGKVFSNSWFNIISAPGTLNLNPATSYNFKVASTSQASLSSTIFSVTPPLIVNNTCTTTGITSLASGSSGFYVGTQAGVNRLYTSGTQFLFVNSGNGDAQVSMGHLAASGNATVTGASVLTGGVTTPSVFLTGTVNTLYGSNTMSAATTASNCVAIGFNANAADVTGNGVTAIGKSALAANTAANNTAVGSNAMAGNTTGSLNVAVGSSAAISFTSGNSNTSIGYAAGTAQTSGDNNTYVGRDAGVSTTTASGNVYIGRKAGNYLTTQGNRIILNSIDRTTSAKDTTDSPIYINESSTVSNQQIFLNGVGYISNGVSVGNAGAITSTASAFRLGKGTSTLEIGESTTGVLDFWGNTSSISSSNYMIRSAGTNTTFITNGTTNNIMRVNGSNVISANSGGVAVTGSLSATTNISSSSPTAGIGYAVGSGSAVTQASTRTTSVVCNSITGAITLVSAAGSSGWTSMKVGSTAVGVKDNVIVTPETGTTDRYLILCSEVGAGFFYISYLDLTGTTTEQPVFNFAVIKGQTN